MKYFFLACSFFFYGAAQSQAHNDSLPGVQNDPILLPAVPATTLANTEAPPTRKPFHFITHVPGNIFQLAKVPFQKKNLKGVFFTAGMTAVLMHFDQKIKNELQEESKDLNISSRVDFEGSIKLKKASLFKLPGNINTAFYQLGENTTPLLLAGGFYLYGKISHNYKSLQTAGDLAESFLTMGISIQILKRVSGRQAPSVATVPGGLWRPFPSFSQYQRHIAQYDAFPSGHLATLMATITTLALDYPEKKWIKPVGYSLMSLLGLSMINNNAHWASDYPLGIAIGYLSSKITFNKNHPKKHIDHSLAGL
jgi:membrane-associated phospholipid phosphatase